MQRVPDIRQQRSRQHYPIDIQANEIPRVTGKRALVIAKAPGGGIVKSTGEPVGLRQPHVDPGEPREIPDGKRSLPMIGMLHALVYKALMARGCYVSPHYNHHRLTPIDYRTMLQQMPAGFLSGAIFTLAGAYGRVSSCESQDRHGRKPLAALVVVHCYSDNERQCDLATRTAIARLKLVDSHRSEIKDFRRLTHLYRTRFVIRLRAKCEESHPRSYTTKPDELTNIDTDFLTAKFYDEDFGIRSPSGAKYRESQQRGISRCFKF